jgi:hypothetical protein
MRERAVKDERRKSFWFDARFAIGIGLVVVSVVAVYGIVTAADQSVQVYAAGGPLTPGDRITEADLVVESVRLGGAAGDYLSAGELPDGGLVVVRSVDKGELVPMSAIGDPGGLRVASVVVTVSGQLSRAVGPAAVVDIWAADEVENGLFGPPAVLVGSATVVRVLEESGIISDGRGTAVEVLVPRERIARVLEAVANGDAIALVPVSLPVGD